MQNRKLNQAIENIRGINDSYTEILGRYRKEKNVRLLCSVCENMPPEIPAAFGICMLRAPLFLTDNALPDNLFDGFIKTEGASCCSRLPETADLPCFTFSAPEGYGQDAAVSLHNQTASMLKEMFAEEIKSTDIGRLQHETGIRENLRRTVRGICAARNLRPSMLSQEDLSAVMETALILPPEPSLELIEPVLEALQAAPEETPSFRIKAMLSGPFEFPGKTADLIEEEGILIAEDDFCRGRRNFDISLNHESEYLFYELLDTYSYRPMHPCVKAPAERFDLLYRLLGNYGIETVIFLTETGCGQSDDHADYMRKKMMRQGIDPLTVNNENYKEAVKFYMEKI